MEVTTAQRVCIPADQPLAVRVEPWSATTGVSGAPRICIEPFEVRLPVLTMDLGRIVVRLPKVLVYACVGIGTPGTPSPDALAQAIRDAPWTATETEVVPPTVDVTPVGVHGLPRSDTVLPICLEADFDSVQVSTQADAVEARLHGCIVSGSLGCGCEPPSA